MKIGHKVPPHGGNGKQTGENPIMRVHHKDGVTTDCVKGMYPALHIHEHLATAY